MSFDLLCLILILLLPFLHFSFTFPPLCFLSCCFFLFPVVSLYLFPFLALGLLTFPFPSPFPALALQSPLTYCKNGAH